MISVTIFINGNPIITRSASRTKDGLGKDKDYSEYTSDDGTKIWHVPEDGAIALAIKMLKNVEEVGVKK